MTAGLGRPLILTTLETPEAMRLLAAGGPRRPLFAALALVAGMVALSVGVAWAFLGAFVTTASAASPAASAAGGDPRSSGQGPGLVGDPLFAVALVLAIGLATIARDHRLRATDRRPAHVGGPAIGVPVRPRMRWIPPVGPSDYWQEL